ncbi:MAG: hypothetical protein Q9183_003352, partial [Haloplaca sp. 2 TL-2023]
YGAIDKADDDGLPPLEPAPSDREDDGGKAESPDDEAGADIPARVERTAETAEDEEEEG